MAVSLGSGAAYQWGSVPPPPQSQVRVVQRNHARWMLPIELAGSIGTQHQDSGIVQCMYVFCLYYMYTQGILWLQDTVIAILQVRWAGRPIGSHSWGVLDDPPPAAFYLLSETCVWKTPETSQVHVWPSQHRGRPGALQQVRGPHMEARGNMKYYDPS